MHSWSTFGAKTHHRQTRTHKTHHSPNLGGATTFPLIVYFFSWPQDQHPNGILSQDSQVKVPKFPKLGFMQLWGPMTLCVDLRLKWGLKQSYSPYQELSYSMLYDICTWENWGDSWLLVVGRQIGDLISNLSFGHNLCFKCPNRPCKPILDICILRFFQWFKEHLNLMGFDPWNFFLKV